MLKVGISLLISLSAIGFVGCKTGESASSAEAIIGANDMKKVDGGDAKIVGSVGYFSRKNGTVFCNGFFNSPTTVLTAKHCFSHISNNANVSDLSFTTASKSYPLSNLGQGWRTADVLQINVKDANTNFLEVAPLGSGDLTIYSYVADKSLMTNSSAKFTDNGDGSFYHMMDTIPSGSGSPILQNGKVVGVHVGAVYADLTHAKATANIASQPSTLTTKKYTTIATQNSHIRREDLFGDSETAQCLLAFGACGACLAAAFFDDGSTFSECIPACGDFAHVASDGKNCGIDVGSDGGTGGGGGGSQPPPGNAVPTRATITNSSSYGMYYAAKCGDNGNWSQMQMYQPNTVTNWTCANGETIYISYQNRFQCNDHSTVTKWVKNNEKFLNTDCGADIYFDPTNLSLLNSTTYKVFYAVKCGTSDWGQQATLAPNASLNWSCNDGSILYVRYMSEWLCGKNVTSVKWAKGAEVFKPTQCGMDLYFQ